MPYFVEGYANDCKLTAATDTAKKAFAEAIEWYVVNRFSGISISDGTKSYSIPEFAEVMALMEIAALI